MANRRDFLKSAACAPATMLTAQANTAIANPETDLPTPDSILIKALPEHFDVDRSTINLENAYWGVMPRVTAAAYARNVVFVNQFNSMYARDAMPEHPMSAQFDQARSSVADLMRVQANEIAFARSGSEGLQSLIVNYRNLKPGDAVIYCDLDYDNMIGALKWLGDHRGIQVVHFTMPEPATTANILAAYDDVLKRTPKAKLLLLTHVSHRTGLVPPAREIISMARARGVDTILDSAHAIGCLNVTPDDLGADFMGWSMHKWLAAPLSLGAIYVRRSRLDAIDSSLGNPDYPLDDIRSRLPAGMTNLASQLTVPTAVAFYRAVGPAAKEAHLRLLRSLWVDPARGIDGLQILTPEDPARSCAITSFRLRGMHTEVDASRVQRRLLEKHRILTVVRTGIAGGPAIRVTPGLFTLPAELDALVTALRAEHNLLV